MGATIVFNPNVKEPKYDWVQELRAESKTQEEPTRPRKFTKKKTLSQLVKSKMLGIKFLSHVNEQTEHKKQKEQKREKNIHNFKCWVKTKKPKKQKKRPKFDLR